MQLVSVRLITDDITRLVTFYEHVTGLQPRWLSEQFAEFAGSSCTLAIGSVETMALFGAGVSQANGAAIIEFLVDDVDRESERLAGRIEIVQPPTTMPWGNRSLLFRDPDGNLVNFFTPVTEQARARLGQAGLFGTVR